MADSKAGSRPTGMNIDTALVRELAEMLADTGLTEIEVEDGDRKIKVSRGGGIAPVMHHAPAPVAPPAAPVAAAPAPLLPPLQIRMRSSRQWSAPPIYPLNRARPPS